MFDALVPVIGYTLAVASLVTLAVCALINTVRGK